MVSRTVMKLHMSLDKKYRYKIEPGEGVAETKFLAASTQMALLVDYTQ